MKNLMVLILGGFLCAELFAGELEIVKAVYGAGDKVKDVTEVVKEKAQGMAGVFFAITPSNQLFGEDPAPKQPKNLTVTYKEDGAEKTAVIKERAKGIILPGGLEAAQELKLLKAFYGTGKEWKDVTDKATEAVANKTNLTVNNTVLGPDPAPKKRKELFVIYTVNNEIKTLSILETKQLTPDSFTAK